VIRARLSARTIKIFNVISRRFGSAARSVVVAPKWFVGKEETINGRGRRKGAALSVSIRAGGGEDKRVENEVRGLGRWGNGLEPRMGRV